MKCPNLNHSVPVCKSFDEGYTPSTFQLEEYCRTEAYKRCPFFVRMRRSSQLDRKPAMAERP